MSMFIGRKRELEALQRLRLKRASSLAVVWGRRRIGKSRLIEEFINQEQIANFTFTGLFPGAGTSAQDQREEFVRQMAEQGIPAIRGDDWGDIFWHLGKCAESQETIILFDEISWMGSKDPTFLGKLNKMCAPSRSFRCGSSAPATAKASFSLRLVACQYTALISRSGVLAKRNSSGSGDRKRPCISNTRTFAIARS